MVSFKVEVDKLRDFLYYTTRHVAVNVDVTMFIHFCIIYVLYMYAFGRKIFSLYIIQNTMFSDLIFAAGSNKAFHFFNYRVEMQIPFLIK